MNNKNYVLFIMGFSIYTLCYGAFCYRTGGLIGLMIGINFYMLGGVLGVYLSNEKK